MRRPRISPRSLTTRLVLIAAGLIVAFAGAAGADDAPPSRPNVVLIVADDLGWGDVGWHGSEIKTPNLDKLAAAGAKLEQFYVQPVCSPTRAALMTGRYPMRHGLQVGVVRPWAQYGLPLDEVTLPQELKRAGYETAIVGKWHLGHVRPDYLPTHRGFDHQYGHYNGALDYFTHERDGGHDWHRDDRENRDEGYTTSLVGREAVARIETRDASKPLFLYVPFNAVHAPHQVPPKYKAPYASLPEPRRTYAGMLAALDEAVGQIVAAVDRAGLRKSTLFVFTSDNGGPRPGVVTSNGPLRGAKGTLYEGGVRVAACAAWEGQIPAGSVVNAPLHAVDLLPTLARLAGIAPTRAADLDGRDAWPAIARGAASPHDAILVNAAPAAGAVRVGDWKLIVRTGEADPVDGEAEADAPAPAPKKKAQPRRKAAAAARATVELYDLRADPYEKADRAAAEPARVAELRGVYDRLARQAIPPKAAPRPPGFRVPRVWGQAD